MNGSNQNLPLLDVPYFQQTSTATCGPACLMMVMKYWDPSLEFSRKMEFYLWKKSYSLFMFGGTFQYGLAVAATTLGYTTEIYQKTRFSDGYPKYPELATLIERMVSHKALRLHISIQYGYENIRVVDDALRQKIPPIVFINLLPLLDENVAEIVVGFRIVGPEVQGLVQPDLRFIRSSRFEQSIAEVIRRSGGAGRQCHSLLELFQGFVGLTGPQQGVAQIVLRHVPLLRESLGGKHSERLTRCRYG